MTSPGGIALVLVGLVVGLTAVQRRRPTWFRFLPVPFWCYFLPMCLASVGFFPSQSPLYGFLGRFALPVCLGLLLLNVDLWSLARLGRPAVVAMGVGSLGIGLGAVLGYALCGRGLPTESWKAVGALSASWTGGSANMLAVKEALSVPDAVFAPVIVVDSFFAYAWMALLISLAGHQERFDRWIGGGEPVGGAVVSLPDEGPRPSSWPWGWVPVVALSLAGGSLLLGETLGPRGTALLARVAPGLAKTFSASTWTILFVTTAALGASLTRRFGDHPERTERWGTFVLYVLLASLGARASLTALSDAPLFLAVGVCILVVHGVLLMGSARLFRLPLFLLASASQACVGGVVSAPMVSAVYRPALSAVGLLLAVLGNVLGTYFGIVVAHLCSWVGGIL